MGPYLMSLRCGTESQVSLLLGKRMVCWFKPHAFPPVGGLLAVTPHEALSTTLGAFFYLCAPWATETDNNVIERFSCVLEG